MILGIVLLWILHVSLAPFELESSLIDLRNRIELGMSERWLGHALVFAALGGAAALQSRRLRESYTILLLGSFALGVEFAQIVLVGRHARIGDWALGAACASITYLATMRLLPCLATSGRLLGNPVRTARALFLVTTMLGALCTLSWYWGTDLQSWDLDYPLIAGDEADGSRPWRGDIEWVVIYPRAPTAREVAKLANGPWSSLLEDPMRYALSPLIAYEFNPIHFGAYVKPRGSELLDPGPAREMKPHLDSVTATSAHALAAVTRHLAASASFGLEVKMRVQDLRQFGPARILSQSLDPYRRNFTLSQSGANLVFRVRNAISGRNGTRGQASWVDVLEPARESHLVVTYEFGTIRLFIDGLNRSTPREIQAIRSGLTASKIRSTKSS